LTQSFNSDFDRVSRNFTEINEFLLTQPISAPGVFGQVHMLDKSVPDAQCVVTAQLQLESSVIIYINIITLANHTLLYPNIVPNVCIVVSQTDRGFICFNTSQVITTVISLTNCFSNGC